MVETTECESKINVGFGSIKTNMLVFGGEGRLGLSSALPQVDYFVSASFLACVATAPDYPLLDEGKQRMRESHQPTTFDHSC